MTGIGAIVSTLQISGEVSEPRDYSFHDLAALPDQVADVSTLVAGREGVAVKLSAILSEVEPATSSKYVTLASTDGEFSASVPIEGVKNGLVVYKLENLPLPESMGGPYRFLIPDASKCGVSEIDACANVKFLGSIHVSHEAGKDTRPSES